MHKFEDFMGASGYEHFRMLVDALREEKLACYVGAGLSLYSKRWGEPFEKIVDDLIEHARDSYPSSDVTKLRDNLQKLYLLRYSLDQIREFGNENGLREAETKLCGDYADVPEEELKEAKKFTTYPELGNKLGELIDKCQLNICGTPGCDTINDWFCRVFKKIEKAKGEEDNKETHLSGRPYSFPAIYFLPYLGKTVRYITTNCDESFETVGKKLNPFDEKIKSNWAREVRRGELANWVEESDVNRVFYIHGCIADPTSLVMTQKAYKKAYSNGRIEQLLRINGEVGVTLLFLGAGMNGDKTVDALNNKKGVLNQETKNLRIPVFPSEAAKNNCRLKEISPIVLCNDYNDISILLHQLIRETHKDNDIYSWKQDLNKREKEIDAGLKRAIDELLEGDDSFKEGEFEDGQRDDILRYLYRHFLCENGKNQSPDWTLCRIYDRSFQFKKEVKGPLHSYPLGNTIYMLGGSQSDSSHKRRMNENDAENIVGELRRWLNNVYPAFPDDEKFSAVSKSEQPPEPKIRIIKCLSPLSLEEQIEMRLEELNIQILEKTRSAAWNDPREQDRERRESMESTRDEMLMLVSLMLKDMLNQSKEDSDTIHRNVDENKSEMSKTRVLKRDASNGGGEL